DMLARLLAQRLLALLLRLGHEPRGEHLENALTQTSGAVVGVVLVYLERVNQPLEDAVLLVAADVRDLELRGRAGVGLEVPRVDHHRRHPTSHVAGDLTEVEGDVTPAAGELTGEVNGRTPVHGAVLLLD